jgi:hypothetical protein
MVAKGGIALASILPRYRSAKSMVAKGVNRPCIDFA